MAITSDAGVMLKPSCRGMPCLTPPSPTKIVAQGTIVQIDHTAQYDPSRIDAQLVAVLQMIVDHRGQQVVGLADRIHVAHEMQVDVLGGYDLGVARRRCRRP